MFQVLASFVFITWLLASAAQGQATPHPGHSFSDYKEQTIQGFHVLVNKELLEHKSEADEVLGELSAQLEKVVKTVPPKPLGRLRKVRFWVERDLVPNKAAVFRVSAEGLLKRGDNPAKAGGVEIANARNFVNWSHQWQPWAALHELAHAYQFHVLGYNNQAVLGAYRQAMNRKLYAKVRFADGGEKEGYAATNEHEYFAELSEAYFGKNDFYPFTRDELKTYDPVGYRLMEQVWGRPRGGDISARTGKATKR